MSAERPDPREPRGPDYGDGGRPAEALVADDASDERPAAGPSDEKLPAEAAGEADDYRAPEEGGEGPPAEATPQGEPMEPMAPVAEDQDPPFTDPFGPGG
jgi:hypothetical protein